MKKINPWIHWTVVGFAIFNILLGLTLYFSYPRVPFIIISPIFHQPLWATIFLCSGLVMLYGLFLNRLKLLRFMMIFGLFVKTMWVIGLVFRINEGGTLLGVLLWAIIAYQQWLAVVYFNPELHHERT